MNCRVQYIMVSLKKEDHGTEIKTCKTVTVK